jgi:hypothetical protein
VPSPDVSLKQVLQTSGACRDLMVGDLRRIDGSLMALTVDAMATKAMNGILVIIMLSAARGGKQVRT